MRVAIGNDHAAVALKEEVAAYIRELGHTVINYGTDTCASCNYPEYGEIVARAIVAGGPDSGDLFCGNVDGISIAAI